jgi:seryl-tRNA synthetase
MLQLPVLREKPEWVKERLAIKHFAGTALVDAVLSLDEERKKLQLEFDNNKAKVNVLSKEIGQLMAKGQKEEAEAKKKGSGCVKRIIATHCGKIEFD